MGAGAPSGTRGIFPVLSVGTIQTQDEPMASFLLVAFQCSRTNIFLGNLEMSLWKILIALFFLVVDFGLALKYFTHYGILNPGKNLWIANLLSNV
jgi:hypothetical protein